MSKKSKSKRFTQQGADTIKKHDERFPYRQRLSEATEK
ncbi:competence protein [Aquibacillus sediminis]|nr:competence protein [Aquibacillus sediminis]